MALPRFEVALGVVDGVNVLFTTPTPYVAGSVAVFLNGQLKRADFMDGWVETSPSLGQVTLSMPPEPAAFGNPDDVVQIFYLDTSDVLPETEVTPLRGSIQVMSDLTGELVEVDVLGGLLEFEGDGLLGEVAGLEEIGGNIEAVGVLRGRMVECC